RTRCVPARAPRWNGWKARSGSAPVPRSTSPEAGNDHGNIPARACGKRFPRVRPGCRDCSTGEERLGSMTATIEPELGRSRRRKEDARLITGRTRWTDNIALPGLLHMAVLRSPLAHAKITRMDAGPARETPGLVAVPPGAE